MGLSDSELLNVIIIPTALFIVIVMCVCTCVLVKSMNKRQDRERKERIKEEREKEKMKEERLRQNKIENKKKDDLNQNGLRHNGYERVLKKQNGINNNAYEADINNHREVDVDDVYTTENTPRQHSGDVSSRSNSTIITVKDEKTDRPNSTSAARILSQTTVEADIAQDGRTSSGSLGREYHDVNHVQPNVDSS